MLQSLTNLSKRNEIGMMNGKISKNPVTQWMIQQVVILL